MRVQNLDFRRTEVSYVTRRWMASESCSLVGVGSVGKSNLLQHLINPKVIEHFCKTSTKQISPIIIDSNLLGALPNDEPSRCWAGFELLMHRLYMAFYPFDILGEEANSFFETYQALQDGTNPLYAHMGLRYLELGIEFFTRRNIHIIFMFDEFENFLHMLPPSFFLALRGLRDIRKQSLSYLTFSREPLYLLAERSKKALLEPFVELFSGNELFVGPYELSDSTHMLDTLCNRHGIVMEPEVKTWLISLSGGFAGLLRACFHAYIALPQKLLPLSELGQKLITRRNVLLECETIWNSLSQEETTILNVANGSDTYQNTLEQQIAVEQLIQKRLLRLAENQFVIEPPLLGFYLKVK